MNVYRGVFNVNFYFDTSSLYINIKKTQIKI